MDDREMLELAAKAILPAEWHENAAYMRGFMGNWHPLQDDGDALRLAVDLGITVMVGPESGIAVVPGKTHKLAPIGDDKHAATRRAIVMAAAEIGRDI